MERVIQRVDSVRQQQAETYRYWRSRPDYERMEAVAQIVRDAYALKGIDLDAQRPERSITRIQRTRGEYVGL